MLKWLKKRANSWFIRLFATINMKLGSIPLNFERNFHLLAVWYYVLNDEQERNQTGSKAYIILSGAEKRRMNGQSSVDEM